MNVFFASTIIVSYAIKIRDSKKNRSITVKVAKNDKKDNLLLIVLVVLLLGGILLTAFCSERKSRHGYGNVQPHKTVITVSSLVSQKTH